MPKHCRVSDCTSNYDSQSGKVRIFSLPSEKFLQQKWINKIPTDLSMLKNPVLYI